ncbi:MAG TPA: hypothetical protein ENN78_02290 [Candidatus Omnitrophica bacterium]|nr:hypothetical protein [Candidatus Omnitrophota bacterium]
MKVNFYKIEKKRLGEDDVVIIYTKGNFSGTLEIKDKQMHFDGQNDSELMDIIFRPYHIAVSDNRSRGVQDKVLQPGSSQHLEAVRRSCWSHGYISEMEES